MEPLNIPFRFFSLFILTILLIFVPKRYNRMEPTSLSKQIKALRKEYNLTQQDLAFKSGIGLRFLRELEQGKPTVRMDKVNQVLDNRVKCK